MIEYSQEILETLTDRQLDAVCAVHNGYGEDWVDRHPDLVPEYCNKWSECGELLEEIQGEFSSLTIEDSGVCIKDTWHDRIEFFSCSSTNLKRNIVIVYILNKQESNKNV